MGRLGNIFRALWNKMLGRTESKYYSELLDLGYEDFANMVAEVGAETAKVATSKHRIIQLIDEANQKIERLDKSAVGFLEAGDESQAVQALNQKAALTQHVISLQAKLDRVNERQGELEATKLQLDQQQTEFMSNKELMKAEHAAAAATAEAARTVTGIGGKAMEIGKTVARLQESTKQMEAEGDGIKELMTKGVLDNVWDPGKTPLDRSMDDMERQQLVQADLDRIKKQIEPAKATSNSN
jgi:phage shock protein A